MMEQAFSSTLTNTPLDLQITICIFLHPSDILALRKTCKALELATRKRIVWVTVLHRVCLDNTLFLPSFPIPDMSDLELERAAIAPRRWIGALQKQHSESNDFSEMLLHTRRSRTINDANKLQFFIVPGGRYLVTAGKGLSVWDLGYVSTVDCKLVASIEFGDYFEFFAVQPTPDGKGLIILSSYNFDHLSIFEIYPQSEIPLLTRIAHLDWFPSEGFPQLLPDTVICRVFYEDRVVFRVVDYRRNCSTRFSADIDAKKIGYFETFATKTAIILSYEGEILIWAIPPLSPHLLDIPDHFLDNNPIHVPPLFKIPFPDGIVRHTPILRWMTVSSWYFGSLESFHFDILYKDSKLQRFKIIIEPDLSDASLHVVDMSEMFSDDLMESLETIYMLCEGYRICEDSLVCFWNLNNRGTWGAYTGLMSTPFTNVVTRWTRNEHLKSLCPTSGRFVYCADDGKIIVADLF